MAVKWNRRECEHAEELQKEIQELWLVLDSV